VCVTEHECILIVDNHPISRGMLAQELRAAGYHVVTADTGERAFHILRAWGHPIGWLYCSAALPGLIDACILADQYHDSHPNRPAVVSAQDARPSARRDIVLNKPTLATVLDTIRRVIDGAQSVQDAAHMSSSRHRHAA
jgi:CheY-like chemotaxis protein